MATVPIVGGLVQLFDAWLTRRQIDKWIKFFTKLVVSYWVTWSGVTGGAFMAHVSPLVAIGSGMVSGAGVVIALWARDPLTKGMFLGVPQKTLDDIGRGEMENPDVFVGGGKKP